MAYYGAIGGHYAGVTMVNAATRGLPRLFMNVRLYEVNDPLQQTIAQLNEFQPDFLFGYTGALTILAGKQRAGALRISPVAVGTAGESMGATDKKTIEDAFGCTANNGYGSSERMPAFVDAAGNEDFISPHTINEIFVAGVSRFQLQITGRSTFRFLICLDTQLRGPDRQQAVAAVAARLWEILAQKKMSNVNFEVVVADDIPVNPRTRKFQLIVDATAPMEPRPG